MELIQTPSVREKVFAGNYANLTVAMICIHRRFSLPAAATSDASQAHH